MTDDRFAYLDGLYGTALRAEIVRLARSEGAKIAYLSALQICGDKTASATARASSQRVILDLAGLLDAKERQAERSKDPAEMSGDELQQEIARLRSANPRSERKVSGPFD